MSIARRPLIWVSIFDHLEGSFRFSCELIYTIEALKSGLAAFLLMKETEEDRLILKKRGQQRPLRDNLTLGSYGIVDGSGLDLEVTGGGSWLGYGKAADPLVEGLAGTKSSQDADPEASESEVEMEMDAYGEYGATSEDSPSQPRSPSPSEASISSSDGMSADSDFSEEVGGTFFDGRISWCEECYVALVDWECPNGHELRRCKNCGWQLDNGLCKRCLGMGGAGDGERVSGPNSNSEAGEESEDDDIVVFDERDGLWRCMTCQWEVEADNERDGNCHCLNDKNEAHFIHLSDCLDYEPADSCSSADDSTDSEPYSDDEGFIDDTEIPLDGTAAPDATLETINPATLYTAKYLATLEAAEMAKGADKAKDKKNIEPTASSDDIEIIDAPTANGQPDLPSNIIDCESMDV